MRLARIAITKILPSIVTLAFLLVIFIPAGLCSGNAGSSIADPISDPGGLPRIERNYLYDTGHESKIEQNPQGLYQPVPGQGQTEQLVPGGAVTTNGPAQTSHKVIPPITSPVPSQEEQRDENTDRFQAGAEGGFPISDSAYALQSRLNDNAMLEKIFDPQNYLNLVPAVGQMAASSTANSAAGMGTDQAQSAIAFVQQYLVNFTTDPFWLLLRNQLFVPMAILLLLPGAVLAQARAIIAQGSPILGEVSPFDGITRSLVAIFLIPGSILVINYGIDVANSITWTINTQYFLHFGSDMYTDALIAEQRAMPVNSANSNLNYIPTAAIPPIPVPLGTGPWAAFESKMATAINFGNGVNQSLLPDEQQPSNMVMNRLAMNGANATLAMTWNIMCAFQMAFLYYLWCMGPIAAALWVWPMERLRAAFPSWIEGVITLCFWSLFWNTVILLMACFKGVGETGTVIMAALNGMATLSVQYAFDFSSLISQGAASQLAGTVAHAMKKATGGGGGGGGGGGAKSAGGGAGANQASAQDFSGNNGTSGAHVSGMGRPVPAGAGAMLASSNYGGDREAEFNRSGSSESFSEVNASVPAGGLANAFMPPMPGPSRPVGGAGMIPPPTGGLTGSGVNVAYAGGLLDNIANRLGGIQSDSPRTDIPPLSGMLDSQSDPNVSTFGTNNQIADVNNQFGDSHFTHDGQIDMSQTYAAGQGVLDNAYQSIDGQTGADGVLGVPGGFGSDMLDSGQDPNASLLALNDPVLGGLPPAYVSEPGALNMSNNLDASTTNNLVYDANGNAFDMNGNLVATGDNLGLQPGLDSTGGSGTQIVGYDGNGNPILNTAGGDLAPPISASAAISDTQQSLAYAQMGQDLNLNRDTLGQVTGQGFNQDTLVATGQIGQDFNNQNMPLVGQVAREDFSRDVLTTGQTTSQQFDHNAHVVASSATNEQPMARDSMPTQAYYVDPQNTAGTYGANSYSYETANNQVNIDNSSASSDPYARDSVISGADPSAAGLVAYNTQVPETNYPTAVTDIAYNQSADNYGGSVYIGEPQQHVVTAAETPVQQPITYDQPSVPQPMPTPVVQTPPPAPTFVPPAPMPVIMPVTAQRSAPTPPPTLRSIVGRLYGDNSSSSPAAQPIQSPPASMSEDLQTVVARGQRRGGRKLTKEELAQLARDSGFHVDEGGSA